MKRGKTEEEDDNKLYAFKWKTVRVCPTKKMTNAMEFSETKRYRIDSLEEYIDAELDVQRRIFNVMECDKAVAEKAIAALRLAYESSSK